MMRLWHSGFLLVVGLGLAWALTPACDHARDLLDFPFGSDHGEGLVWGLQQQWHDGRPLFSALDEKPWLVCNYPPVYLVVADLAATQVGSPLAAGRWVSLVAAIWSALMLCLAVVLIARSRPWEQRLLAGLVAGLVFLNNPEVVYWGTIMRIDMLALAFSLTGLVLLLAGSSRPRAVFWCLPFFLLAAWTKPTMVLAALGGFGALFTLFP